MKRLFLLPAFVAALFIASCEKDPDMDKLDNDYLVYTNYDEGTDFGKFNTYYVIDSILIIGNNEKTEYWKNENSKKIINAYADRLEAAGYTRVGHTKDAEIVLQLSYISATYYFNSYDGPWWNSYPGYWNWGGWGWYYPYSVTYSYSTGSIIGELVDTRSVAPHKDKLTVIWNSYICGLLNNNNLSYSRTMEAISQAFRQSPYISKK